MFRCRIFLFLITLIVFTLVKGCESEIKIFDKKEEHYFFETTVFVVCVFVILTLGIKFKFGTLGNVPECYVTLCQQPVKEIFPYEVRLWNTFTELLGVFMNCSCILAASNEQKRFEYSFVSSMYNGVCFVFLSLIL